MCARGDALNNGNASVRMSVVHQGSKTGLTHKSYNRASNNIAEPNKNNTSNKTMQQIDIDKQIKQRKLQSTIKQLEVASGKGTSMISLFIPPGQLHRATKMLTTEYGVSTNIKSRV